METPPKPASSPRKPTYYEAIALYEGAVRALQRHDFAAAADGFRAVVQRYPEERELLERARLYLRVCERELAQRPAGPQTAEERIYTATVALNAGDYDSALAQLKKVLDGNPDNDHAHYILSVALTERRDYSAALDHLKNAVAINAENRSLALQDPDLEALRFVEGFRGAVDTPSSGPRKRPKPRK